MTTATAWVAHITRILVERGYAVEPSTVGSATLLTKRVRGLGPFFPVTDFIFIHDCSTGMAASRFEELHEQARAYAESRFRLPRPLRYHIPNTVSIGVSDRGFSAAVMEFAQRPKLRSHLQGGEKNSTYLFDVGEGRIYSQGAEKTPGNYGTEYTLDVNPTNRTLNLMREILAQLVRSA